MSSGVIYNNNVLNQGGTPALITFNGFPTLGFVGRILYNSNDHKIYQDTGTAWVEYGGGGGQPNLPTTIIDNFVQNTFNDVNIWTYSVPDTYPFMRSYRISSYLNILSGSVGSVYIQVSYVDKNNTQKTILLSNNNNDTNINDCTILPYPGTQISVDIINGTHYVDGYAALEKLYNSDNIIIPFQSPLNVNAQNNGTSNYNNGTLLCNNVNITNLTNVTIGSGGGSVLGNTFNYLPNNDNSFSFNGLQSINIIDITNYANNNPIPFIVNSNLNPNAALTIAWADLQPNIADGINIIFEPVVVLNTYLVNASSTTYNNLTIVLNTINVSGLTFLNGFTPGSSQNGISTNQIIGSNTYELISGTGQNITIFNFYTNNGNPIPHTITNNGTTLVTVNCTLDSTIISEGVLIQLV